MWLVSGGMGAKPTKRWNTFNFCILFVQVCLKSFEICRINNDLRCTQQVGVYGVTEVSLVMLKMVVPKHSHCTIWVYIWFMYA